MDTKFKKGLIPWNKKPRIEKVCKCGKVFYVRPCEIRVMSCSYSCCKKGLRLRLGSTASPETRLKQRIAKLGIRGENHWNWRGGKRTERKIDMTRDEYIQWRKSVFKRDNFTCQICFKYGVYLHADHIKPYAYFPELRYELNNGRTLCADCHRKTDTWGAKAHKYKESLNAN